MYEHFYQVQECVGKTRKLIDISGEIFNVFFVFLKSYTNDTRQLFLNSFSRVLKFPRFLRPGYSGIKNPITRFPVPVLGKKKNYLTFKSKNINSIYE
jgi:hypothetical protein